MIKPNSFDRTMMTQEITVHAYKGITTKECITKEQKLRNTCSIDNHTTAWCQLQNMHTQSLFTKCQSFNILLTFKHSVLVQGLKWVTPVDPLTHRAIWM